MSAPLQTAGDVMRITANSLQCSRDILAQCWVSAVPTSATSALRWPSVGPEVRDWLLACHTQLILLECLGCHPLLNGKQDIEPMLGQRRRRWANLNPTLDQCLVFNSTKVAQWWANVWHIESTLGHAWIILSPTCPHLPWIPTCSCPDTK